MFLVSTGLIVGLVIVALVIILIIACISTYNKLVQLRNKVKNQLSQVDVQLKKRFDLIPNLVETCKGYAAHEESIYGEFAKARGLYAQASQQGDVNKMAEADKGLSGAISRLLMVQERYPELKADKHFTEIMQQLKDCEKTIATARQFYNDIVQKYNDKVEMFPSSIIAKMFKFKLAEFYTITNEAEREAPKVKF